MPRTGQDLYKRAKSFIPGGTQLLSKRPEMFLPENWPAYYSRAKGVEVWDLDGKRYLDLSYNSIGACVLGMADPDVDAAVKHAIDNGSMSTLNCAEEVELAELLLELDPWAEMVRFGRSGGEAMTIAVRIARAHTGRDRVAFCGYHGWHDWYLAANLAESEALDGHLLPGLAPAGVPRGLLGTALPFRYNRVDELKAIVARHPGEIGTIVMEPMRDNAPANGFLEAVRDVATEIGAVLIFDEITSGFRLCTGGAYTTLGVQPDVVVYAKALGNGYPMAAIVGRGSVMSAAQRSFISSTYWTERVGPTAALAMIRKHREKNVSAHLVRVGTRMIEGWKRAAGDAGVPITAGGMPPLAHFGFSLPAADAAAASTLYTQIMLEHGFLANKSFYATYAHQDEHVDSYMQAATQTFAAIRSAIDSGTLQSQLRGPTAHTGFHRLT